MLLHCGQMRVRVDSVELVAVLGELGQENAAAVTDFEQPAEAGAGQQLEDDAEAEPLHGAEE
jgi:hypothetical protein